jgi:uncharacterized membrane protein YozB (DUF420 family)
VLTIILGIVMLVSGIRFLVRGKIRVGRDKEVRGASLVLVALFLMLPLPVSFGYGFVEGWRAAEQGLTPEAFLRENQARMILVELGIYVVCGLLALIFTFAGAQRIERDRTDDHFRRFMDEATAVEEEEQW